jgi:predicted outer membrane protein
MAEKRGQDDGGIRFGMRMVEDREKDLRDLKQLAKRRNSTLPDPPIRMQKKEADKLNHLSGTAFDREYPQYEAKDRK